MTQSSQTQTGAILGTADYMSPEQIRGHKVDGRSDIFAVGVILYRLLTGKKPFKGENIQSVFFKILNSDAPELLLPDGRKIPELQAIVDRAMAKDADDRYGLAGEMAEDISQFLQKYKGAIAEETIMEPAFDPGAAADHDSSGRMRRSTMQPGTGTGRMPGTSGGVSRTHRPVGGTVAPTTAGAVPGTIGGTVSRPTAVVPGTRIAGPPRPRPAASPSRSVLPLIIGVLVVLGMAAGGYYLYEKYKDEPATVSADLASRFDFAEQALEAGRYSQAFDQVENILGLDPDNQRALQLKAQIQEAMAQQDEPEPTPTPQQPAVTTSVPPTPVAPSGPTPEQRAQTFVADASMAINRGDLTGARNLINQGRQIAPSDPRWNELNQQIARKENENRERDLEQQKASVVTGNLKLAGDYMAGKDYDRAVAAYDKILEVDPNNTAAITGRNNAIALKQMEEAARTPVMAARNYQQTQTEFISGKGETPKGFQAGGGVNVKKGTSGPGFAGELIIELNPPNAQPGQPYVLRVRLHNKGNGVITVKFLELVSTYGGKATGKGQQIPPKTQRVSAQANSVLHEVRGTWSEAQNQGSITAILTLVGNARVTKTLSW